MMNWREAKKAMRKGEKVSHDRSGKTYFVKQGKHIVCYFRFEEDADCGHMILNKSDHAFYSLLNGWFIVKEEEVKK